eukprot:TRINITY_DN6199_c1_g1_i1.p1 TRINITY_DN6199_c1_g1~~TRINITY_DN6199_c1_g1_i1.p1  ORF type:complete len:292 (+),score=75.93 TRINITY_DN6199_c1_g1_i1:40-915(+)
MPREGSSSAAPSGMPTWLVAARKKFDSLLSAGAWDELQGMHDPQCLIIPLCGETFVPAEHAAMLFRREDEFFAAMVFTPTQVAEDSGPVHEIGTLRLVARRDGSEHHTHYYTRWREVAPAEWRIVFQCLSVGERDRAEPRVKGLCVAQEQREIIGSLGAPPPSWLLLKERTFVRAFNHEELRDPTQHYYHPAALVVVSLGTRLLRLHEVRDYLAEEAHRHHHYNLALTPVACHAEGQHILHELGVASDADGARWQYYVQWVRTGDDVPWRAALELCVVADVHAHSAVLTAG